MEREVSVGQPIAAEAEAENRPFAFVTARTGDALRLAAVNALLTLATLGVYRFWARSRYRRFLWRETRVLDEPFEYTGRGMHLFLGFLIAVAIVVPVTTGLNLAATLDADRQGLYGFVSGALLFFLLEVGLYRARRYRLGHTLWRGIRFDQSRSGVLYAIIAIGGSVVVGLTAGLANPWLETALQRERWRNTWFGNQRFAFEGSAWPLFWRWLVVLVLAGMAVIVFGFAMGPVAQDEGSPRWTMILASALILVTAGAAYAWYRAAQFRHYVECTSLGGAWFYSSLRVRHVLGVGLIYALALLALLALLGFLGWAVLRAPDGSVSFDWSLDAVAVGALVVAGGLAHSVLYQGFLVPRFAARLWASVAMGGSVDLAAIEQQAGGAPGVGEGLAGLLDVGGSV